MNQATIDQPAIEYGKPQVERKINDEAEGIFDKIVSYKFNRHTESVPGSNVDRTDTITTFSIRTNIGSRDLEHKVEFNGFVGAELVGQEVQYDDKTTETTTYFDPTGRENEQSYRKGKKETKRVQRIIPKDGGLPIYISEKTSQVSL